MDQKTLSHPSKYLLLYSLEDEVMLVLTFSSTEEKSKVIQLPQISPKYNTENA